MMKGVSVIVNLHREGLIAFPTLQSVENACDKLKDFEIGYEILHILDNSDEITNEVSNNSIGDNCHAFNVDFRDLGLSRNFGIKKAKFKYVAFIDGDDLFGHDWLWRCIEFYEKRPDREMVLHPELNYIFGMDYHFFYHTDMESTEFDLDYMRISNYWTALSFSKKSIYEDNPYSKNHINEGFGFEDWHWNCNTIENGIIHKVVPETCHLIRKKESGSLLNATSKNNCIMTPSALFNFDRKIIPDN